MKLKKFKLYWTASVHGATMVEAFDEQDAEEQFSPFITEDMLPDEPAHAELDFIKEVKTKPIKPSRKKK